jgi:hypothetical protein
MHDEPLTEKNGSVAQAALDRSIQKAIEDTIAAGYKLTTADIAGVLQVIALEYLLSLRLPRIKE